MYISESELFDILSEVFDEGQCGYADLKQDYIENKIEEIAAKEEAIKCMNCGCDPLVGMTGRETGTTSSIGLRVAASDNASDNERWSHPVPDDNVPISQPYGVYDRTPHVSYDSLPSTNYNGHDDRVAWDFDAVRQERERLDRLENYNGGQEHYTNNYVPYMTMTSGATSSNTIHIVATNVDENALRAVNEIYQRDSNSL